LIEFLPSKPGALIGVGGGERDRQRDRETGYSLDILQDYTLEV
jgi:hypothetical protein